MYSKYNEVIEPSQEILDWLQGLFYPSLGAEFQPHSQSKIVTFFPNTMSDFPN